MRGKNHEDLNMAILKPLFFILIIYGLLNYGLFDFRGLFLLFYLVQCILFYYHGKFHTYYVTPDNDTHSRSTKRLGLLGKIIDFAFPHHGLLHSPILWTGLYVWIYLRIESMYGFQACFLCGGLLAIYLHLISDLFSHTLKVAVGKVKRLPVIRHIWS